MKKTFKAAFAVLTFLVIIPALAGLAIMWLWNNVVVVACGFATVCFWQSVGLFLLGQILSGGFVLGLIFVGGSLHVLGHQSGKGSWGDHWHNMTDEQRKDFIASRRAFFKFRHDSHLHEDAAQ